MERKHLVPMHLKYSASKIPLFNNPSSLSREQPHTVPEPEPLRSVTFPLPPSHSDYPSGKSLECCSPSRPFPQTWTICQPPHKAGWLLSCPFPFTVHPGVKSDLSSHIIFPVKILKGDPMSSGHNPKSLTCMTQ